LDVRGEGEMVDGWVRLRFPMVRRGLPDAI
jgi:hypothetical protein